MRKSSISGFSLFLVIIIIAQFAFYYFSTEHNKEIVIKSKNELADNVAKNEILKSCLNINYLKIPKGLKEKIKSRFYPLPKKAYLIAYFSKNSCSFCMRELYYQLSFRVQKFGNTQIILTGDFGSKDTLITTIKETSSSFEYLYVPELHVYCNSIDKPFVAIIDDKKNIILPYFLDLYPEVASKYFEFAEQYINDHNTRQ